MTERKANQVFERLYRKETNAFTQQKWRGEKKTSQQQQPPRFHRYHGSPSCSPFPSTPPPPGTTAKDRWRKPRRQCSTTPIPRVATLFTPPPPCDASVASVARSRSLRRKSPVPRVVLRPCKTPKSDFSEPQTNTSKRKQDLISPPPPTVATAGSSSCSTGSSSLSQCGTIPSKQNISGEEEEIRKTTPNAIETPGSSLPRARLFHSPKIVSPNKVVHPGPTTTTENNKVIADKDTKKVSSPPTPPTDTGGDKKVRTSKPRKITVEKQQLPNKERVKPLSTGSKGRRAQTTRRWVPGNSGLFSMW
mmetsp:Transcript_14613/g.33796  ORF Transcript_14613/g.33796 Transcript_14613/m.33796 type:complete len:305 (-) Transcript_14613:336-1250(-)